MIQTKSLLHSYTVTSVNSELQSVYLSNGVFSVRGLFDQKEINEFLDIHKNSIDSSIDWSQSYLESRNSFTWDESVRKLLCGEKINSLFSQMEISMMLVVAEARLASSNISWHRDVTWETDGIPKYVVVSIALSDATDDSGWIAYVPGSHVWDVDYGIVGREKIYADSSIGYKYYEEMINTKSARIEKFDAKAGDVLVWNGNTVHMGEKQINQKALRHTLTGHFSHIDEKYVKSMSNVGYRC